MSPLKAIKEKCLDCCCWQAYEVRICDMNDCPLHPFRLGKHPKGSTNRKPMTEEQRAAAAERLKIAREAKNKN